MHTNLPVIHIHLGIDNVMENTFEKLSQLATSKITNISSEIYKGKLQKYVDDRNLIVDQIDIANLGMASDTLTLSRPKFFYSGKPLNTKSGFKSAMYKMDTLQKAFSNFQIYFHIFITDHVSYLYSKRKNSPLPSTIEEISWRPFITALTQSISNNNKLLLHNAENLMDFSHSVNDSIWHHPEHLLEGSLCNSLAAHEEQILKAERWVHESNLNIYELDEVYEGDLSFMEAFLY